MMAGMAPGFNLTIVALITLILVLNVPLGLSILTFALGRILAILLAPWTFELGYYLIHHAGLEGFIRWTGDTPVVALMDLHFYCLFGGLIVGAVLGAVIGALMGRFIVRVRKMLAGAGDASEVFRKLSDNFITRGLLWILFGKQKKTMKEMLEGRDRIIRPAGVIIVLVFLGLTVGTAVVGVDYFLAGSLADAMGSVNGAEVNITEADLSFARGRMRLEGLQVTDPGKPTHNIVQMETLASDVSITGLLTRRLIVDEIRVSALRTDARRESPGEVYQPPEPPPADPKIEWPGDILWDYFENPEKYHKYIEYLERLKEYLEKQRQAEQKEVDKEWLEKVARARGYFALSARSVLAEHPTVVVRKVVIDKIRLGGGEQLYRLEADELSSHPVLNPKGMKVRFGDLVIHGENVAFGKNRWVEVNFGFHTDEQFHHHRIHYGDIEVGRDVKLSKKVPLKIALGKAHLVSQGRFNYERWDSAAAIKVEIVQGEAREGRGMLGMAAGDTRRIASALTDINLAVAITGPLTRPRVVVDPRSTLKNMADSLSKIGRTHLATAAGDALKRVGSGAGQFGKGVLKSGGHLFKSVENLATGDAKAAGGQFVKGAGDLFKGLGDAIRKDPNDSDGGLLDILNGKNKDANDTDDKTSDPNEDKGPLDRLFGG
jgi:uncharacterized protein (TIGR03546 family)